MKRLLAIILVTAMLLGLTACGVPKEQEITGDTQKVFRYSIDTELTSLDPSKANSCDENEVQYALTEGLVNCLDGEIQPGLADTWSSDETGTVWTFHIREDAAWSDGQQITARDFEYSWKRLADPATGSGYAWIMSFVSGADDVMYNGASPDTMGVKALDDSTLEVRLSYVAPYFLFLIGSLGHFAPLRQDVVEQYGQDFAADASKNIYSGPYKLVSSDNLVYVFEPNEYYWNREAVHFDRVELSVISDPQTALALYDNGELDYCIIPRSEVTTRMDDPAYGCYVNGNTDWLYINHEDVLMSNRNLRLALNYALDRNAYNTLANGGTYKPFNGVVCDEISGLDGKSFAQEYEDNRIYPLTGDVDLAKKYLAEAMEELNITDPADVVLTITSADAESSRTPCEVIQNLLQETLGITVELKQVTYGELYSTTYPNHDYQLGYGGWGPDYDDPYTYLELFYSGNSNNYSAYSNAEVDALLENARVNPNVEERMENLGQTEKLLLEDGAVLPLQMRTENYLMNENLTGIFFNCSSVNMIWAFADYQ